MDLLTLLFALLSFYAAGFVVFLLWLVYARPEPSDLMIASALYIMGMAFVSVGCVMVVSPQAAARLNELADDKIRLGEQRAAHSLLSWRMRIGGVFLTSTGALLLAVAVKITLEAVGVLRC